VPSPTSSGHDHKGAQIKRYPYRTLLGSADIVVVRFVEKYKQWTSAFERADAAASAKPFDHPAPGGAPPTR